MHRSNANQFRNAKPIKNDQLCDLMNLIWPNDQIGRATKILKWILCDCSRTEMTNNKWIFFCYLNIPIEFVVSFFSLTWKELPLDSRSEFSQLRHRTVLLFPVIHIVVQCPYVPVSSLLGHRCQNEKVKMVESIWNLF